METQLRNVFETNTLLCAFMYHEMCRQVKFNVNIHLKMWRYSGVIRGVFGGIPGMFGGIRGICGPWNAYVYYICLGTTDVFYNIRKVGGFPGARQDSRILHNGAVNICSRGLSMPAL